jgi:hypothetical protein
VGGGLRLRVSPEILTVSNTGMIPPRPLGKSMILYGLLEDAAFDDRAVEAMTTAYEGALQELDLPESAINVRKMIARKIIECARLGERDPVRLRELALNATN